jgi:signal transduction histidine kinase
MMNFFHKQNLAKKLTLLTLVMGLFGSWALFTVVNYTILSLNDSLLQKEVRFQKEIITNAYSEPLWNFDKFQIESVSRSFLGNSGFVSIEALHVVDAKGVTLFRENKLSGNKLNYRESTNEQFSEKAEGQIVKNGEVIGKVYATFSSEGVMTILRSKLKMMILSFFLIVSFIGIAVNVFLNKLQFLKNRSASLEKEIADRSRELESQILKNTNSGRLAAAGELACGIAHEINNPLMVINGQILKLKRQIKNTENELLFEMPLAKISFMSERIVKIVNGLKLISRDGQYDPMIEFSVHKMVEEVMLLTEIKLKSLEIQFELNIDLTVELGFGREVQISQVLVNLINNSIDAVSTLEEKWIRVSVFENAHNMVEFEVTDSGQGIPLELRDKIMQPFFTTKEVGNGTGLGLSISMSIIKDHGGTFYYNEQSPNTQFKFTILKQQKIELAS